jgi:hypothetical protein
VGASGGLLCHPPATPTPEPDGPCENFLYVFEYACHLRDVLLVQRERVHLALVEDTPHFVSMYRDARVDNARYDRETADDEAQELAMAGNLFMNVIDGLSTEQLARRCIYKLPRRAERAGREMGYAPRGP